MCERERLLRRIQMVGFALVDLNLYLDTHPNCPHALEMFNEQSAQYAELQQAYADKFGPLSPSQAGGSSWDWISGPWPWEMEA